MSDPSPAPPEIAPPATPQPEIDPTGIPPESPAPDALPDDGYGRPVDGSVMASVGEPTG